MKGEIERLRAELEAAEQRVQRALIAEDDARQELAAARKALRQADERHLRAALQARVGTGAQP